MKQPHEQGPGIVPQNERIAVIGSGIAGCLAAHELASEGYDVTIIEEREKAFSGTSAGAIQAHLGGLYSGSPETARECLHSAIELKKAMPFGLNDRRAMFLVANRSEVSLGQYVEFYRNLTEYYDNLPFDDQVFGPAENFFRILEPEEHEFAKNVEGGIATQEPGLDMMHTRSALLRKLGRLGAQIVTRTEVIDAARQNDGFALSLKSGDSPEQANFDQVINAGSYKARLLDHKLGDRTPYNLYLKTWNIVRNGIGQEPMPPFYVVRGDFMHHSPIGYEGLVSLITATNEGSYLGTMSYDEDKPTLPLEWLDILDGGEVPNKRQRQRTILEYAGDEFINDAQFEPVDLMPGVAVSFSTSRQDRTKRGANKIVPGWQTIIPTKATNALELAREARDNVVSYSASKE